MERLPRIVPCGGRRKTYDDFRHACDGPGGDRAILLVDSEDPVATDPWQHLAKRDGWQQPPRVGDEDVHLMVQCMESWFYADKDTLSGFFGDGFSSNALSGAPVEEIPTRDVLQGLKAASRRSRKGVYDKGRHSFAILQLLDPDKVCGASPHARRLVDELSKSA